MKEWYTPAELAGLALPGMPTTERAIRDKADTWRVDGQYHPSNPQGTWRKRQGRGGGYEYHYSLLPSDAQVKLVTTQAPKEAKRPAPTKKAMSTPEAWDYFARQPDRKKEKANHRLKVLDAVEALKLAGRETDWAVRRIAEAHGLGPSTIYNWYGRVAGVDRCYWAAFLIDRHAGRTAEAEISLDAWEWFKGEYLRLSQPALSENYRRLEEVAAVNGWTIPSEATVARKVERLDPKVVCLMREGEEKVARKFPAQRRDRSMFKALEAVNFDGHKFDVFVEWPGTVDSPPTIGRAMGIFFQDLYSNKILSWRIDVSENSHAFLLAFGDLVEKWGIPDLCWGDNTRAAAGKWLTGGTPHRYRFKAKETDPSGVFVQLGVEFHPTMPYHGQSKPIERAFRDLAEKVSKSADCDGAYTGNSPTNKPANYGERAVPIAQFVEIVAREVARYNAQKERRTKVCGGVLSFDEAFDASYKASAIRKATAEQRRMWLTMAQNVSARKPDGAVHLMGNRYWSQDLIRLIGHKLTVRFDPDNLHQAVHVYRLDGSYVCAAECVADVGFKSAGDGKAVAKARGHFVKATKELAEAEVRYTAAQVAAALPKPEEPEPPEAKVVRLNFNGNTALKIVPQADPQPQGDPLAALANAMGGPMRGLKLVTE